ncbi:unnamed protein product [Sphacelaria rigidula]
MDKCGYTHGDGYSGASGGGMVVSTSPWRPLCSLDRRTSPGGIGVAACLPDRLCLVARGGLGGGIAHLITRPLFPLEPLLTGALAASRCAPPPSSIGRIGTGRRKEDGRRQAPLEGSTLGVVRRLVARYAPPKVRLPEGTSPGDGPGLGAGATCDVFRLLTRYGLHILAAEVAGVNSRGAGEGVETRSADVFMRRRPWISPMERARCASSLGLPLTAMVEGIGDDPALVDSFLDPDAMTSALLPAIGSR